MVPHGDVKNRRDARTYARRGDTHRACHYKSLVPDVIIRARPRVFQIREYVPRGCAIEIAADSQNV